MQLILRGEFKFQVQHSNKKEDIASTKGVKVQKEVQKESTKGVRPLFILKLINLEDRVKGLLVEQERW